MKAVLVVLAIVMLSGGVARGQEKGFGLGVILGDPTGVSAKYWLSQRNAIDGALAWSFRRSGFFHVHADYLWHFPDAIHSSERFVPYVGPGVRLGAGKGKGVFGIRIAAGMAYLPHGAPLDIFAELAPVVDLAPSTEASCNIGLGIRFFF